MHAQVASGPFNAREVDFNALNGADMSKLVFDMLCPSSATWDSFVCTQKNSPNFSLEENPIESEENEDVVLSIGGIAPLDNMG
ncbi:hypothetical protein PVK06_020308 [Gossypium arboreum]|uniref:Uncharacterized protein n=1 Tax=Gossypium arboreum TaxID=29729 RepID=A0ABR0PMF3_GOSAR|nr:hypothetical protein PVK06_020308 [Gossypium arboreum]